MSMYMDEAAVLKAFQNLLEISENGPAVTQEIAQTQRQLVKLIVEAAEKANSTILLYLMDRFARMMGESEMWRLTSLLLNFRDRLDTNELFVLFKILRKTSGLGEEKQRVLDELLNRSKLKQLDNLQLTELIAHLIENPSERLIFAVEQLRSDLREAQIRQQIKVEEKMVGMSVDNIRKYGHIFPNTAGIQETLSCCCCHRKSFKGRRFSCRQCPDLHFCEPCHKSIMNQSVPFSHATHSPHHALDIFDPPIQVFGVFSTASPNLRSSSLDLNIRNYQTPESFSLDVIIGNPYEELVNSRNLEIRSRVDGTLTTLRPLPPGKGLVLFASIQPYSQDCTRYIGSLIQEKTMALVNFAKICDLFRVQFPNQSIKTLRFAAVLRDIDYCKDKYRRSIDALKKLHPFTPPDQSLIPTTAPLLSPSPSSSSPSSSRSSSSSQSGVTEMRTGRGVVTVVKGETRSFTITGDETFEDFKVRACCAFNLEPRNHTLVDAEFQHYNPKEFVNPENVPIVIVRQTSGNRFGPHF